MKPYALIAITKHGVNIARTLHEHLPCDLYYMEKFARGDESERGIRLFSGSPRDHLPELFQKYKGLVMFFSLGAVVRLIAPLIKSKHTDPAVVVVDDQAKYVISVLSGHLGGANMLTREVARILNAEPVITTASEVNQTIAVDLLGRPFGWVIEDFANVTPVSAAVVNEEPVAIIQEAGERNWWTYEKPLPENLFVYRSPEEASVREHHAVLYITDRLLSKEEKSRWLTNGVLYRPKTIILGIGCNRGTPEEEVEQVIRQTLHELSLSFLSVRGIATIDLKKDEEALLSLTRKYGWTFQYYTPEELNRVPISHPSETVYKYTGAYGVSEPAAKLAAGCETLLLAKKKDGNVTISVARVGDES
jgi:cobalt-precorrin 5A hydrolase